MAGVEVVMTEIGIPLVRLTGPLNVSGGAALADEVMRSVHFATEDLTDFPHPLSERAACVRAPQHWTVDPR